MPGFCYGASVANGIHILVEEFRDNLGEGLTPPRGKTGLKSIAHGACRTMAGRMRAICILLDRAWDMDADHLDPQDMPTPAVQISHAPGSCQTLGAAKVSVAMTKLRSLLCRRLAWFALLTAAGGMLASCDTPVGVAPGLQGTYWQNALVTNPTGGGPQVVRWGPPQNYNPSGNPH